MKQGLKVIIVIILFILAGFSLFVGTRIHIFGFPVSVAVLALALRMLLRVFEENDDYEKRSNNGDP
jgi:hypothetical protein